MNTSKHTPGPWVVDEDYADEEQQAIGIVKDGHGYIAGIHILASANTGCEGFSAEDRANAHLIAAAPTMYEALQTLVEYLSTQVPADTLDDWKHVFAARQALAQAEGKTL